MEQLTFGFQVGEAGDAPVQQKNLAVPDGVAEILHGVHSIGSQITQRIVEGNAVGFGVGVEVRHVYPEGDTVKWL